MSGNKLLLEPVAILQCPFSKLSWFIGCALKHTSAMMDIKTNNDLQLLSTFVWIKKSALNLDYLNFHNFFCYHGFSKGHWNLFNWTKIKKHNHAKLRMEGKQNDSKIYITLVFTPFNQVVMFCTLSATHLMLSSTLAVRTSWADLGIPVSSSDPTWSRNVFS